MGLIILPNTGISIATKAIMFDYWEDFGIARTAVVSIDGTVDGVPNSPILQYQSDGQIVLFRESGQPPLQFPTYLRPVDGGGAHRRVILTQDRILFGVGRYGCNGYDEGVFRNDDPFLLSHYRLDEKQTISSDSPDYPADETDRASGSSSVNGVAAIGAGALPLSPLGNTRGLLLSSGYLSFGYNSVREAQFSSGIIFDFIVDFTRSFDVKIEDVPGGTTLLHFYRHRPEEDMHFVWRDSVGADIDSVIPPTARPTGDIAHLLIAIQPSGVFYGYDGTLIAIPNNPPANLYDMAIEQAGSISVRLAGAGGTEEKKAVYANFRLWDAEIQTGASYTVPTTHDDTIPEFATGVGIDISAYAQVPNISTISRIQLVSTGVAPGHFEIGDFTYTNNLDAVLFGRARYKIPKYDGDFRSLTYHDDAAGVRVADVALAFDYANTKARITAKFYTSGSHFDVEAVVLYSLDGEKWEECTDADYNSLTGLPSSSIGASFGFEWDLRDALPSEGSQEVYVTVLARRMAAGLPYADPRHNAIKITVGAEEEQTVATLATGAPPIDVVNGSQQFQYKLSDRDSTIVDIDFQYSLDGGLSWSDCAEDLTDPATEGKTNLVTSPVGVDYIFAWDTDADGVRATNPMIRVLPKKPLRPSPRLISDFRFYRRVKDAWDFLSAAPLSIDPNSSEHPQTVYSSGGGNFHLAGVIGAENFEGTIDLVAGSGMEMIVGLVPNVASIAIPYGLLESMSSPENGFCLDVKLDLNTAKYLTVNVVSLTSRVLASIKVTATKTVITVETGKGSYTFSAATGYVGPGFEEFRFSVVPTDDGFRAVVIKGGAAVLIDESTIRSAAILSNTSIRLKIVAGDTIGQRAKIGRLVLMDDDQFLSIYTPPAVDDTDRAYWNPKFPQSKSEIFEGISWGIANASVKDKNDGGTALGIVNASSVIIPQNRGIRVGNFNHGFGLEFKAKIVPNARLDVALVDDALGTNTLAGIVIDGSGAGSVIASIAHSGGAFVNFEYPYAGANWWPNNDVWHHFRLSVRTASPYLFALSIDGSKPIFGTIPAVPDMFVDPAAQRYLLLYSDTAAGALIDDLKVWDGYHMSPYPVPVPEEPQSEYWKP